MKAFVYLGTVLLLAALPMCSSPSGGSDMSCPQGMTCGGGEGGAGDGASGDGMGGGDGGGGGGDTGNGDGSGGGDGGTSLDGIVPPDRTMNWTVAGVPGGIPDRTMVCATLTPGATAAQINAAIDACPAGQVVKAPAGVYMLDATVGSTSHDQVTLRGDGPGKTMFVAQAANTGAVISFGGGDWPPPPANVPITAGATKNSTTITVDSTSMTGAHPAFTMDGFLRIEASNNPPFVHDIGADSYNANLSMTFRVKSLTPTTVTFEPPLPFDLSTYAPMAAVFTVPPLDGVGVEDLTIDMQNGGGYGIQYGQMWGSWIRNVEIEHSAHHVTSFYTTLASEIRHCHFHDSTATGPDTEGLDFYMYSDWDLVEDNIVYDAGGVMIGDWEGGDVGNVVAYNYLYGTNADPQGTTAFSDIDLNHGSNNILNLVEGNVIGGGIVVDGYFGSASHDTIFRNWITATHPTATNSLHAIWLKHFSDYFNVVGNVLGTSAFPTSGNVDGNGHATGGFYEGPQVSNYDDGASTGVQTIYEFGFPNMGNTGFSGMLAASMPIDYGSEGSTLATSQELDLNVAATVLRHGNYDYFHKAIVWDPMIAQHAMPDSLVHSAKPAWFGKLAWPPFDPASPPGAFGNTTLATIPAGYRYVNGVDP